MLCQKNIRLNLAHYFIMKLSSKCEPQQIGFNDSSDIDFKDFMNLYIKCTSKPYFSYGSYSCIITSCTFQKESFRKNIKANDN